MTPEAMELSRKFAEVTKESTLVEIADAIIEAAEVNEYGEFTPESLARLESLQLTMNQKGEAYAVVCTRLAADAAANDELSRHYAQRCKARRNVADRLKQRLQGEMERIGVTRLEGPLGGARLQDSPPSVEIVDESKVQSEYTVVTRTLDRKKIMATLRAGASLSWAKLVHGRHVRWL